MDRSKTLEILLCRVGFPLDMHNSSGSLILFRTCIVTSDHRSQVSEDSGNEVAHPLDRSPKVVELRAAMKLPPPNFEFMSRTGIPDHIKRSFMLQRRNYMH